MGLLRLMGNKADVVKGLAKRCNENWRVAPTSDIVSTFSHSRRSDCRLRSALLSLLGPVPFRYPRSLDHYDAKSESLREDPLTLSQQLPRADLYRDDGR